LPLDETVVNRCISLRKAHKIKLPDAIVAATALVHNLSLLTRNESDFRKIPDLKLINPHNLV
ncbi:MAG: type II toxin-antitoxin system VapC family toxin, partial [Saprospiraceae bacterium]|nr:type II toxin-antitoxin system VapC family toxin [Saprospiraceae bacterium]